MSTPAAIAAKSTRATPLGEWRSTKESAKRRVVACEKANSATVKPGDEGAGVEDGAHVDRRPVDAGAFEEHRRKRHGDQDQDRQCRPREHRRLVAGAGEAGGRRLEAAEKQGRCNGHHRHHQRQMQLRRQAEMRHGAAEQPGAEEARAPELTVATNSPGVASALADLPLVELFVLGGRYVRDLGTCVGGDTLAAVAQLGADLFFLGSCGLDASRGVTAFDSAEAEVKRAMAGNSAGIVIAVTNDKLATAAPYRVAAPDAISHLVVDKTAPSPILADFERLGAEIHFA
ncbi:MULTISPECIES: DeoR/GlpR family DNA-binding transcription regulator [unclassified Mesorhizobium]|uniref:DeoR/GlpR family DNA-binding transcription regulator n=1 Tax=unclassified Mesorhizobium TaxID=325217 RepID=UPI00241501E8|nr:MULTISPECIES: DeoR/GlpR family DNA-binding transcription regulator [unclassified Mesorhizobium]MDG4854339.1 DeoR/GlpR family DNA-binding transcription regulator [Mesorhizobium sp. WSM4982]MDG4914400.1 DeoR/GlpR family DNA-binding transcription regulator [Mesorhizobium sp. WSM4983]